MKILFVTAHAPFPTHTGSGQRSNLLYRALSALGDVKTITLESPGAFTTYELSVLETEFGLVGTGPLTSLGSTGLWKYLHRIFPKLANGLAHNLDGSKSRFLSDSILIERLNIAELLDECDVVVGRYTHSLTRLGLVGTGKPTFLDVDDIASDIYRSRLQITKNYFKKIFLYRHYVNLERQQNNIFSQLDGTWVVNPDDTSIKGLANSILLPNIPFESRQNSIQQQPLSDSSAIVTSVAAYKHKPNLEGVQWFLDRVWPIVIEKMPEARFHIVGSNLSNEYLVKWGRYRGVKVVGFLEDIKDAYSECSLTICPVQRGAGTNIKVVESGAYGRNCVLTSFAARGYSACESLAKHLWIAENEDEMAKTILYLLSNHDINRKTAKEFASVIVQTYSLRSFESTVRQTFDSVKSIDRSVKEL